jgi:hypothetical protein
LEALAMLRPLQQKHAKQRHLQMAVAASELFAGHAAEARGILFSIIQGGEKLTGSGYFNLACAEISLRNKQGALKALEQCAETEYRTNGTVWQAISGLTSQERSRPALVQAAPARTAAQRDPKSPSLFEIRKDRLASLIRPRRLPATFKPDLGGLLRRDVAAIEQILKDARNVEAHAGYSMLLAWIAKHPRSYTLKAHGASLAIQAGLVHEAQNNLEACAELRPLDRISRYNLAYVYLQNSDFLRLTQVLNGASRSSLAETSDYWLALAIARALSRYGDASDAAGRALLFVPEFQKTDLHDTLRACRISPATRVTSAEDLADPAIGCAREVISRIDGGDVAAATNVLAHVVGEAFEDVPEIGTRSLLPVFDGQQKRNAPRDLVKPFVSAVRSYREHRYVEAAQQFERLYDEHGHLIFASNAIAANLQAEQFKRSRKIAREVLRGRKSGGYWRLAFNCALASLRADDPGRAVDILERQAKDRGGRGGAHRGVREGRHAKEIETARECAARIRRAAVARHAEQRPIIARAFLGQSRAAAT